MVYSIPSHVNNAALHLSKTNNNKKRHDVYGAGSTVTLGIVGVCCFLIKTD